MVRSTWFAPSIAYEVEFHPPGLDHATRALLLAEQVQVEEGPLLASAVRTLTDPSTAFGTPTRIRRNSAPTAIWISFSSNLKQPLAEKGNDKRSDAPLLIVEDDQKLLAILSHHLTVAGHHVGHRRPTESRRWPRCRKARSIWS